MITINMELVIRAPYVTLDEYCRHSGMTVPEVRKLINDGFFPVKPRESEREKYYINMVALFKQAAKQE